VLEALPDKTMSNSTGPTGEQRTSFDSAKLNRVLAKIPWKCLWVAQRVMAGNRIGQWIWKRVFPESGRRSATVSMLCRSLKLTPVASHRELLRVYPNTLAEVVLYQMTRMTDEQTAARFRVFGRDVLDRELAAKRPVMLLGSHFGVNRILPFWIARQGIPLVSIEWKDKLRALGLDFGQFLRVLEVEGGFAARATLEAQRWLRGGGLVHMTGDNLRQYIQRSREFQWLGFRFTLPMGFARLAVQTNATVIPYFCQFDSQGVVEIRFHSPLQFPPESDSEPPGTPAEREARLIERFFEVLTGEIERSPGNNYLPWERITTFAAAREKSMHSANRGPGRKKRDSGTVDDKSQSAGPE